MRPRGDDKQSNRQATWRRQQGDSRRVWRRPGSSRSSSHEHLGETFLEAALEVGVVAFRLVHARYDRKTRRAYVELRDADDDGGEILASAIFSFRSSTTLTDRQIQQEIVRKARYVMKRAAAAA